MISGSIEFFNVAEIRGGVLYRFPLHVCDALQIPEFDAEGNFLRVHTGHRASARALYGAELRFVTEAKRLTVSLESDAPFSATAYNGDFQSAYFSQGAGKIEWKLEWRAALDGVAHTSENRFSKRVWRIAVSGDGNIRFGGIRTENGEAIRPPHTDEVPRFCLLAYGSSISQGVGALYPPLNYLNTAAQILGIDILNKALSGGCFCEKETVDYLCGETFDAVYLEPGTNIADRPLHVIEERVGSLIDTFCTKFPEKKIFVATPVCGLSDVSDTASDYRENFAKTRSVITAHAKKHANAVLLDGHGILKKHYYLSADLLHPSDFGHVRMGHDFAALIEPWLREEIAARGKRS